MHPYLARKSFADTKNRREEGKGVVSVEMEPLSDPTGSSGAQITPQLLLPLTEAKGPFVPLHQLVIGYGPPQWQGHCKTSQAILG